MMGNEQGLYGEWKNKLAGQDEILQALRDQVTLVNNLAGHRSALVFARDAARDIFQYRFHAAFPGIATEAHPVNDKKSGLLIEDVIAMQLCVPNVPTDRQHDANGRTFDEWRRGLSHAEAVSASLPSSERGR